MTSESSSGADILELGRVGVPADQPGNDGLRFGGVVLVRAVDLGEADTARTSTTPPKRRPSLRSEEHTSELQSRSDLVWRPLLEKKKAANLTVAAPASVR